MHRITWLTLTFATLSLLGATTAPARANPQLAQKHACTACHAADKKVVGPAFADIAKKFAGQANAEAALMASIKAGGAGKWGPVPMPPQPAIADADLKALAGWILGGAK